MATVTLFLDESGYTGSDLINRDQPFFTLASTSISEPDARLLLTSCFGPRSQEVKFAKFARSAGGQAKIIEFLRALELRDDGAMIDGWNKGNLPRVYHLD